MIKKTSNTILAIVLIILGLHSLFFQVIKFIFTTFNRNSNDHVDYFLSDDLPHFLTIVICVWFIITKIRKISKTNPKL
jgi:hypothetical protein